MYLMLSSALNWLTLSSKQLYRVLTQSPFDG